MFMGTSTALAPSSAAWSSSTITPHFSSSIPVFHHPTPTTVSNVEIMPFPTHGAVGDSNADVVIKLDADINIAHYHHYYDVPVASFRPKYYALDDGSLLSQRYMDDYRQSRAWVLVNGALCAFFMRNTLSAISYIRRSRVKDKTLFYLLLLSQVLGLSSTVVQIIGDFDQSVNCTSAGAAKKVLMKISCDTMITGILGVKAYRCLSNSRSVLMFLIATAAVMIVLVGLDMSRYEAARTLYGNCTENHDMQIISAMILTAFVETTVLCACFLYAIWRSYRTHTEARVTLRVSEEEGSAGTADGEVKESVEGPHSRRGWWDYVPEAPSIPPSNVENISFTGFVRAVWNRFRQPWSGDDFASSIAYQRKPSLPGIHPIPQPPRPSVPDASNKPRSDAHSSSRIVRSPFHVIRNWIRYFSRMELFRKMLRNELLYTTFLTIVFLALAITMLVGVNEQILLGAQGWIIVDWIIITVCTMQSFERVVHRHELEAVLQHPAAWDRILRSEVDHGKVFFEKRSRRSKSPKFIVTSALRSRHRDEPSEDPDPTIRTSSDGSSEMPVSPLTLTSTPRLSSRGSYKPSFSSSLPSFHVRPPSPPDFISRPYTWDSAVAQPSPHDVDCPLDPLQPSADPVASPMPYDTHTHSFDLRTHLRTNGQNPSDLDNHQGEN